MKKSNKVLALILGGVSALSMYACGGGGNSETEIEIAYWDSGLGTGYIEKVVDAFKKDYPQYSVILDPRGVGTVIATTLNKGAKFNTYDLYITNEPDAVDRPYMETLNDILTATAPGDSMTIGEKYNPTILDSLKANDGNYYNLSYYGGIIGITYDSSIIDGVKYKEPRTTDELFILASQLYADSEAPAPFIHFKGETGGYWAYIYETWRAQYEGVDNFYKFFDAEYLKDCTTDADKISAFQTNLSQKDGRYKVLKYLEKLLNFNYCYNGSNSLDFDEAQTLYLSGNACMMVNGAWMEKEIQKVNGQVGSYKTMKTPVFSQITEKFVGDDKDMDDKTLCEIIDLVDAGTAYSDTVYPCTEATYERVKEARNLTPSNATGHTFTIPNYSPAKEASKEFIKFYYSDKATKIMMDELQLPSVVNYSNGTSHDTSSWSAWSKNSYELFTNSILFSYEGKNSKHDVFAYGKPGAYGRVSLIKYLSADSTTTSYMDADGIWALIESETAKNAKYYLIQSGDVRG